jgi:hypothetical protein
MWGVTSVSMVKSLKRETGSPQGVRHLSYNGLLNDLASGLGMQTFSLES